MQTRAQKMAEKRLDKQVEVAFRKTCSGVQVSVWDLAKIMKVGREAIEKGQDLEATIKAFVETIRHN
jgi:hypothetical protein